MKDEGSTACCFSRACLETIPGYTEILRKRRFVKRLLELSYTVYYIVAEYNLPCFSAALYIAYPVTLNNLRVAGIIENGHAIMSA